jgi:hypothetical protein
VYIRRYLPLAALALVLATTFGGCAGNQPAPVGARELAETQTFPFYRVYWAGPRFGRYRLVAADGLADYVSSVGENVYYGNCLPGRTSAVGGGGCELPLQVNTLIYTRHANAPLGAQRNTVLRGVPATIYNENRRVALYSGREEIIVSSDDLADALRAVSRLRPINAPGSATGNLPAPVYCPGLSGPRPQAVRVALAALPGHVCQRVESTLKIDRALFGKG